MKHWLVISNPVLGGPELRETVNDTGVIICDSGTEYVTLGPSLLPWGTIDTMVGETLGIKYDQP